MNEFFTDLEYSLEERDDEMFNSFYHRAFPNISDIKFCEDMQTQRKGIDKIICFKSGKSFTIDEKKRRVDFGDILLELWSVYEKQKRGWLYTSQCDYIVYAIMPSKKVYLLPTILLQRAWMTNGKSWVTTYKQVQARNVGYTTLSIAIPTEVLLSAISQEMKQAM